jgi:hypothetical protein
MLFTGETRSRRYITRLRANGWGRLFVARPTPKPGEPWALDNGAFKSWKDGKPWSAAAFLRSVEVAVTLPKPMVAVLPDVVGGGVASLRHSMRWRAVLPDLPWFVAVQDGMTRADVEPVLSEVDGIFLGGTDAFKGTAPTWCDLAHEHGKRFHFARVSTENRLRAALECGADSADSSQMLWSDEEFAKFERRWFDLHRQERMFA